MKNPGALTGILLILIVFTACSAAAETRYVSDELVITLRQGKGNQYKILRTLKTGTPVEILEEDGQYLKGRTRAGDEGYILMTKETPKATVIARLEKDKARLEDQLAQMEKKRAQLASQLEGTRQSAASEVQVVKEEAGALKSGLAQTEKELQSIKRQYEDLKIKSESVLQLSDERDSLQDENTKITAEVLQLREENEKLLRTGMIQWFLAGGGVLFVGWVAGKLSRKKKRSGF